MHLERALRTLDMRFHVNRNIDTDEPERFQKVVKSKKE